MTDYEKEQCSENADYSTKKSQDENQRIFDQPTIDTKNSDYIQEKCTVDIVQKPTLIEQSFEKVDLNE